jgi:hypothetical protein
MLRLLCAGKSCDRPCPPAFRFPEVHARAAVIFGILFDDFDSQCSNSKLSCEGEAPTRRRKRFASALIPLQCLATRRNIADAYAHNDPGLKTPQPNRCVVGRHRSQDQSAPSGLDRRNPPRTDRNAKKWRPETAACQPNPRTSAWRNQKPSLSTKNQRLGGPDNVYSAIKDQRLTCDLSIRLHAAPGGPAPWPASAARRFPKRTKTWRSPPLAAQAAIMSAMSAHSCGLWASLNKADEFRPSLISNRAYN